MAKAIDLSKLSNKQLREELAKRNLAAEATRAEKKAVEERKKFQRLEEADLEPFVKVVVDDIIQEVMIDGLYESIRYGVECAVSSRKLKPKWALLDNNILHYHNDFDIMDLYEAIMARSIEIVRAWAKTARPIKEVIKNNPVRNRFFFKKPE